MADAGLDDFFARKDKKKRKAKTVSSELIGQVEESMKKSKKKRNKRKIPSKETGVPRGVVAVTDSSDDEWVRLEERPADYSGLRVAQLVTTARGAEDDIPNSRRQAAGETAEYLEPSDEDPSSVQTVPDKPCPWKKLLHQAEPATGAAAGAEITQKERTIPSLDSPLPSTTAASSTPPPVVGKYVPPAKRRHEEAGPGSDLPRKYVPPHARRGLEGITPAGTSRSGGSRPLSTPDEPRKKVRVGDRAGLDVHCHSHFPILCGAGGELTKEETRNNS